MVFLLMLRSLAVQVDFDVLSEELRGFNVVPGMIYFRRLALS